MNRVMRNNGEPAPRVESVHRALVLLKLISEEGSLSVTEAAQAVDIHPATAQRLLMTLVGDDFARQGEKRRYFPGPALLRTAKNTASLKERVRPFLERLYEQSGETVHLASLIGTEVHHPDCLESVQPLRFGSRVGTRVPAHVTSEGKSMLAELPWEEVEARYSVALLGRLGHTLHVDLGELREELERTRERGYATNFEESEPGIAAFAVSLGRIDGQHGSLSIAMPIARYSDDLGESMAEYLKTIRTDARDALHSA